MKTSFLDNLVEFNLIDLKLKPNANTKIVFWDENSFEISCQEEDFSIQTSNVTLKKLNMIQLNMSNIKNYRKPDFFEKKAEDTYICHMQNISPITNQSALLLFSSPESIYELIVEIIKLEEELLLNGIQEPYTEFSIGVIDSRWVIDLFPKEGIYSLSILIEDIYTYLGKHLELHNEKLIREIEISKTIRSKLEILNLLPLEQRFFQKTHDNDDDIFDRALGCMIGAALGGFLGLPFKCCKPSRISDTMIDEILTLENNKKFKLCQGIEMGLYLLYSLYERFHKYNLIFLQEGWDLTAKWYSIWFKRNQDNTSSTIKNAFSKLTKQKFDLEAKEWANLCRDSAKLLKPESEGNSSLMRIIPLAIIVSKNMGIDNENMRKIINEDVYLTHCTDIIKDTTFLYCLGIRFLIHSGGDMVGMLKLLEYWIQENSHNNIKIKEWWKLIQEEKLILDFENHESAWTKLTFVNMLISLKKLISLQSTFCLGFIDSFNGILKCGGDTDTNSCLLGGILGAVKGASKLLKEIPDFIPRLMFDFEPKQPRKLSICYGLQIIKYLYKSNIMKDNHDKHDKHEKHNQRIVIVRNNGELPRLPKRRFGGKMIMKACIKNHNVKAFKKINKKYMTSAILPPPSFNYSLVNQDMKEKLKITYIRFERLTMFKISSFWSSLRNQMPNHHSCDETNLCKILNKLYLISFSPSAIDSKLDSRLSNSKYFLIPRTQIQILWEQQKQLNNAGILNDDYFGLILIMFFEEVFKGEIPQYALDKLENKHLFPWAKCFALYKIAIKGYSICKHIPFLLEMQKTFENMNFGIIFDQSQDFLNSVNLGPFCGCLVSCLDITFQKVQTMLLDEDLHVMFLSNMCKRYQLLYRLIMYILEGRQILDQLLDKIEGCFNSIKDEHKDFLNDILMIYAYILTLIRKNGQNFQQFNTLKNLRDFYSQTIFRSTIALLNHMKNFGIKDFSMDQVMLFEYNCSKILPDLIDDSWLPSAYSIQTSLLKAVIKKIGVDNNKSYIAEKVKIDLKKPLFSVFFQKSLDDASAMNMCKSISEENSAFDQKIAFLEHFLKQTELILNENAIEIILWNFEKQGEQVGKMILNLLNKIQYFPLLNHLKYYKMFINNILNKKYIQESLYYLSNILCHLSSSTENFDKIINEIKKLEKMLDFNPNSLELPLGLSAIFAEASNKMRGVVPGVVIDSMVINKLCQIIHDFLKIQNQEHDSEVKSILYNVVKISENQPIDLDFEVFEILFELLDKEITHDQVFHILRNFVLKTGDLPKDFQVLLLNNLDEFDECLMIFEEMVFVKNSLIDSYVTLGLIRLLNNTNHQENLEPICRILGKQKSLNESIHAEGLYEIQLFLAKYDDDYSGCLNDLINIIEIISSKTEFSEELEYQLLDKLEVFSIEGKVMILKIIMNQLVNFMHFQMSFFKSFQGIYDEDERISNMILKITEQYLVLNKDNKFIQVQEFENFIYFLLEQKLNIGGYECLKRILNIVDSSFKFLKFEKSNLDICEKLQLFYQTHSVKVIRDNCYKILGEFCEIDENCRDYFRKFFDIEKKYDKWKADDTSLDELKQTIFIEDIKISMKFFEIFQEKLEFKFDVDKIGYDKLIDFLEKIILSNLKISLPLFLLKSILNQLINIQNDDNNANDLRVKVVKNIVFKSIKSDKFDGLTEEILKLLEKLVYNKGLFLVEILEIFIEYYKQNFTLDMLTINSLLDYHSTLQYNNETLFNERLLDIIGLCFEYTLSSMTPDIFEKSLEFLKKLQFLKGMQITQSLEKIVYWLHISITKNSYLYPIYEKHKEFLLEICCIQVNDFQISEFASRILELNKHNPNTMILKFFHDEQNNWVRNVERYISMKLSENEFTNCSSTDDLKKIIKNIKNKISNINQSNNLNQFDISCLTTIAYSDLLLDILAIIQKTLYILNKNSEKPKSLRLNQIYSIILMLNTQVSYKGRIAEISTGEGKSLIIAILAIILALTGSYVFIATTYKGLIERDVKEMKPIFDIFGIKCMDNIDRDYKNGPKKCYNDDVSVIYGTVDQFEFDILRHVFGFNSTMGNRDVKDFHNTYILIDEVDFMFIDEPHRMALLSDIPGGIWRRNVLDVKICNVIRKYEMEIYLNGYCSLHNSVSNEIKSYLAECFTGEISFIPKFLEDYTHKKLPIMIDNSIHALLEYKNSVEYIISEGNDRQLDIIPVDNVNTGAIEISKSLSDGLQQALRLKEGLKPRSDGIITNFLPNLTFFKAFGNRIFGFTGTLGSNTEKAMVEKVFNVDYVYIPRNKYGKFNEYEPILESKRENWLKQIKNSCLLIINQGRCILIICESLDEANSIEKVLKSESLFKNRIHKYTRDDKYDEIENINRELIQGDIMIATNLAGRGADIHVSNLVEDKGGLHVCLTFTPQNQRVKLQAFGRTARKGCSGSAQMIIHTDYFSLKDLQRVQNLKEKLIMNEFINKHSVEITKKSMLFDDYCQKRRKFKTSLEKNTKMEVDFALKDLDHYWAMFINTLECRNESEIYDFMIKIDEKINFKSEYDYINPFNLIDYANWLVNSVRVFKKSTYQKAIALYKRAISLESEKLFGAYYKMAYLTLYLKEDIDRKGDNQSYKHYSLEYLKKAKEILQKNVIPCILLMSENFESGECEYKNSYKAYAANKMQAFEYLLKNIEQNIAEIEFSLKKIIIIKDNETKTYLKHSDIKPSIPDSLITIKIYGLTFYRNLSICHEAIDLMKSIKKDLIRGSKFFIGLDDIHSETALPFSKNIMIKEDLSKSQSKLENLPITLIFKSPSSELIKIFESLLSPDEIFHTPNALILKSTQERICSILTHNEIGDQPFEQRLYFNDIDLLNEYLETTKHNNSLFFGIENILNGHIFTFIKSFKFEDLIITNKKDIEVILNNSDININELQELKTEGIDFVFSLCQNKPIPWISIISCAMLGLVQIGLGAYLIAIPGIGTGLIYEGIGDLIFSALALHNRDFSWKQYAIQKAISLSLSSISGGFYMFRAGKLTNQIGKVSVEAGIESAVNQANSIEFGRIFKNIKHFFDFTKNMISNEVIRHVGKSMLLQGGRIVLGSGIQKSVSSLFHTQLKQARIKFALSIDNILDEILNNDNIITTGFRLDAIARELHYKKSNENELRFEEIGQDICHRLLKTDWFSPILNADYSNISACVEFVKIMLNFIIDANTLKRFEEKFKSNYMQAIQRFKFIFNLEYCINLINFLKTNSKNQLKSILNNLQIEDFGVINELVSDNESELSKKIEHHFENDNALKLKNYLIALSKISKDDFRKEKSEFKLRLKESITELYFTYFENSTFRPAFTKYTNFLIANQQRELTQKMSKKVSGLTGFLIIQNIMYFLEKKSLNSKLKQEALDILIKDIESMDSDDNDDKISFAFKLCVFMDYLQYHNHFIKLYIEEEILQNQQERYSLDNEQESKQSSSSLLSLPLLSGSLPSSSSSSSLGKFIGYQNSEIQIYLKQNKGNWIVEKDNQDKSEHKTIYQAFQKILNLITNEKVEKDIIQGDDLDIKMALKAFILRFKENYCERYLISKRVFNGEEMDDEEVKDDPMIRVDSYIKGDPLTDNDVLKIKCFDFFKQFESIEIFNMFTKFNLQQGKPLDLHTALLLYIIKNTGHRFSHLPYPNKCKAGIALGLDIVSLDRVLMRLIYGEIKYENMYNKWEIVDRKFSNEWILNEVYGGGVGNGDDDDNHRFERLMDKYRLEACISDAEFKLLRLNCSNFLAYFWQVTDLKIQIMVENFGNEYWDQGLSNEVKVLLLYIAFFGIRAAHDQFLRLSYLAGEDPKLKAKCEKLEFYKENYAIENISVHGYDQKLVDLNNIGLESILES